METRGIRAVRNHAKHLKEVSPYYRETLADIDVENIATLEDLRRLPFTDKKTVTAHPDRFRAVAPEQIVETVVTSGSTGKPLIFGMTKNDLDRLAFNEALSFHSAGVTAKDRAQLLVSLDRLFIAGIAYYRGLSLLGANTCRVGVLPMEMQRYYLELLHPTVLVGVPSFIRKLGTELRAKGFDTRNSSVKKIFCIGESIRTRDMALNAIGDEIQETWNASVYSTYGNTELSVAYCECTAQSGGHAHPELIYTEILDDNGMPVEDGEPGELVATPLGIEGMPLLRYRTGDITFKIPEQCSCGRNSMRIGPVLARKSQMIKVRGTTLYPLTITNALDELHCIQDYVLVLEGNESLADQVTIHAATAPANIPSIAEHLRSRARVSFPVLVSNTATIDSLRGKSRKKMKVVDKRPKGSW